MSWLHAASLLPVAASNVPSVHALLHLPPDPYQELTGTLRKLAKNCKSHAAHLDPRVAAQMQAAADRAYKEVLNSTLLKNAAHQWVGVMACCLAESASVLQLPAVPMHAPLPGLGHVGHCLGWMVLQSAVRRVSKHHE